MGKETRCFSFAGRSLIGVSVWSLNIMMDLGRGNRVRNLRNGKRMTEIFLSWEIILI